MQFLSLKTSVLLRNHFYGNLNLFHGYNCINIFGLTLHKKSNKILLNTYMREIIKTSDIIYWIVNLATKKFISTPCYCKYGCRDEPKNQKHFPNLCGIVHRQICYYGRENFDAALLRPHC